MIDNDRQQKGLADTYIHYFEAQAARTPEATAAVFGGEELSFGELQRRSNQLARYLQMLGVVPEVLVAICLERSLDLLVALLAVWKSGGAYLPLDAAYPNERLAYLLEDSQAGLLITQPQFSSRFRGAQTPLLHLDEALCQAGAASSEKVHCPAQAGNLAYVIYTSGSTGKPKGVEITHRSLLNHNLAILRAYELVGSDRVLQFASLSFDVSIEEIFPSWLSGAAVVLRDNDLVRSIPAFLNCVERQRISVLNLPTAYWHKWVGDLHEMRWPASVRLVIIGGESASVESYRVWRKAVGPGVALINAYGPTEATITSTIYKAGPQDEALAIGAPLPNVRALVLGEDGKPVAADGIGQLYLGGQGVARGYRNRPGLTAERFISSPLPDAPPSERFYKTGDLVRLRSDGNLDFIGRVDRQIKIRGFRIELEEIEKALQSCAGLKDAVVQMREDPPGQKRLVAYYLPGKQPEPTVSDLLSQLREQLPAYMIPAQFVSLKSLPLTPAGKVDYRALPKPANVRPRMGQRPVEAQTETEQQVGLIWQEVLQIEGLGVRDNFFDLGGDSLLAMQVISRVRDAFGIELPLSRLFDAPTVEGLARRLDSATPDVPNGKELFSTGLPDAGGAPASFSQERLWLLHQMNPKTDAYNMAWALRLKGNLDVAALECALGEVLRRHDVLRTSFRYADGCLMQAIDGEARLEMAATTLEHVPAKQRESKLQQLLALEVRRPFDLAKAPLMRASLFKLSATESALLLVMHHAVSDG